jgi:hypothetical protein
MVVHHIRKPTNFIFNVLSGDCCSDYLSTAVFVEVDYLFVSFSGGKHVDPRKILDCPLIDSSLYTDHWTKMSVGIDSVVGTLGSSMALLLGVFMELIVRMVLLFGIIYSCYSGQL